MEFDQYSPTLSPDGRWLAFGSNASGRDEVCVRPIPDAKTERTQVSVAGGSEPAWSHSGRELFYRDADGMLVAASVEAGSTFRITALQPLLSASAYSTDNRHRLYAVSLDDRSFLFVDPQSAPSSEVVVVLNCFEELKALMDGRR